MSLIETDPTVTEVVPRRFSATQWQTYSVQGEKESIKKHTIELFMNLINITARSMNKPCDWLINSVLNSEYKKENQYN